MTLLSPPLCFCFYPWDTARLTRQDPYQHRRACSLTPKQSLALKGGGAHGREATCGGVAPQTPNVLPAAEAATRVQARQTRPLAA